MVAIRVLVVIILCTMPCLAEWTEQQKGWFLGTSAVLTQIDRDRQDVLWERSPAAQRAATHYLSESWGIHSRAELLTTISQLMQGDSDRLRIGWNYPRVVSLARWGYGVSFLTEAEAWRLIMPAAQRLQQTFSSWQDLGLVYLTARQQWFTDEPASRRDAEWAYRSIATDPNGPWRRYPWNLDLGNGHPVPPSLERTAWIELAAHPKGVMCVRLGVPDHQHDDAYLAAIEEAVGCRPHITHDRINGADWIVDTECTRPGTTVGAQVIAEYHLEAVAELLRRDGFTQVFTYFEHIPHNSSNLVPAAYDSYIAGGWRWYVDMRSLRHPLPDTVLTYGVPPSSVRMFLAVGPCFLIVSLLAAAFARGKAKVIDSFPPVFWAVWLLLSISLRGLAVASFWTGDEGVSANVQALTWYGTAALLLRMLTEAIMQHDSVPEVPLRRLLVACFWRACVEIPFPISIAMLCDPESPLDPGAMFIMLALGSATLFTAWHALMIAQDMKGGLVKAGELHDAVFRIARKMEAPLRRLYIRPEGKWPQALPSVGASGALMIPERLIRRGNRREIDALVGYELMLIKHNYLNSIVTTVAPMLLLLLWRAYMYQHSASGNLTLFREAGVAFSALVAFQKSVRGAYLQAEEAFHKAGGDAEGWIAGLARAGKLAGSPKSPELFSRIAKSYNIAPERIPELVEQGFPETGKYPVPDFSRSNLILLS